MIIRVLHHANVSKQTMLLDGVDFGPFKLPVCGRGLNRSVHEGKGSFKDSQWKCKKLYYVWENLSEY